MNKTYQEIALEMQVEYQKACEEAEKTLKQFGLISKYIVATPDPSDFPGVKPSFLRWLFCCDK